MTEGFIYSITLKGQDKPVYIGQTRNKPEARWRQHMRDKTPISRALQFFGSMDDFEFAVVETVAAADLNTREEFWIRELGTMHPNGLNMVAGGSAARRSAATRARMSEAGKARWADPSTREKMTASLLLTGAARGAKISAALKGKPKSPEHARGMAERGRAVLAANRLKPEVMERWRASNKGVQVGKIVSAETKARMSEAAQRRANDPEWRAMAAERQRKRMSDPALRAGISEKLKTYFHSKGAS